MSGSAGAIMALDHLVGDGAVPEQGAMSLFTTFEDAIAKGDLDLAAASLRLIDAALVLCDREHPAVEHAQAALLRCHTHLWMLRHPEARAAA